MPLYIVFNLYQSRINVYVFLCFVAGNSLVPTLFASTSRTKLACDKNRAGQCACQSTRVSERVYGKCLSHMPWHAPSHVRRHQATHITGLTTHYHSRNMLNTTCSLPQINRKLSLLASHDQRHGQVCRLQASCDMHSNERERRRLIG